TAAVVLAGVDATGTKPAPPAAPVVSSDWKTFQDSTYNLQFRYPPDWVVKREGGFAVVPRELSSKPVWPYGPFALGVYLSAGYYLFVIQNGAQVTQGRLPGGQAFVRYTETASGSRFAVYDVDWGRFCIGGGTRYCGSHSVTASIQGSNRALLDRYGPVAERIVRTLGPVYPTQASSGDPNRPACRQDQWRPVFASRSRLAFDRPRWVIGANVQYLQGPACHLRTSLRLTVERADGTAVAVPGTPSALTVEADLPEDGGTPGDVMQTATMRFWGWDNWCRQPLPRARVRLTTDGGASTTRPLPSRSLQNPRFPCRPNVPWSIGPLP
ncbi:MAG TPA: hypothetical protein VF486_13385, partial [Actinomycetes bacterium]